MPEDCKLKVLQALINGAHASRRVSADEWGNETDREHYLIPRGLWDSLVKAANDD